MKKTHVKSRKRKEKVICPSYSERLVLQRPPSRPVVLVRGRNYRHSPRLPTPDRSLGRGWSTLLRAPSSMAAMTDVPLALPLKVLLVPQCLESLYLSPGLVHVTIRKARGWAGQRKFLWLLWRGPVGNDIRPAWRADISHGDLVGRSERIPHSVDLWARAASCGSSDGNLRDWVGRGLGGRSRRRSRGCSRGHSRRHRRYRGHWRWH